MSNVSAYEQEGHVVTLTLNEPDRRNPLTGNTAVQELLEAIGRIEDDGSVRVVIVTGAGTAFSSGGNIRDMERHASGDVAGREIRQDYRRGIQRLPLALFNLEVPVIAGGQRACHRGGTRSRLHVRYPHRLGGRPLRRELRQAGHHSRRRGAWLLQRNYRPVACCRVDLHRADDRRASGARVEPCLARRGGGRICLRPPGVSRTRSRRIRRMRSDWQSGCCAKACIAGWIRCSKCRRGFQALSHQTVDHQEAVAAFIEKRAPSFKG